MPALYATIKDDKLVLAVGNAWHVIHSEYEFNDIVGLDNDVLASSSIHFPHEHTDNQETLALIKEIFG